MNKEVQLELIWRKIDDQLSTDEMMHFDELCQTDNVFNTLYQKHLKLNGALANLPTQKAPVNMLQNIMSQVEKIRKYNTAEYDSFMGLKYIFISILSVLALVTGYVLLSQTEQVSTTTHTPVADFINSISLNLTLPSGIQSYLPYTLVLSIGLGLIFIDNYLKSNVKTARSY